MVAGLAIGRVLGNISKSLVRRGKKKGLGRNVKSTENKEQRNLSLVQIQNETELERLKVDLQKDIMKAMQAVLDQEDINFSGKLSDSIEPSSEGNVKQVVVNSPYAGLVDKGTPPGTNVDEGKLSRWVAGKLGITDNEENKIATIKIKRKIEGQGIQPTFFVKKALKYVIYKRGVTKIKNVTRKVQAHKTLVRASRMASRVNRSTRKAVRLSKGKF